jgi:hypothetical protein
MVTTVSGPNPAVTGTIVRRRGGRWRGQLDEYRHLVLGFQRHNIDIQMSRDVHLSLL